MWDLKCVTNEPTGQNHGHREQTGGCQGGGMSGRLGFADASFHI